MADPSGGLPDDGVEQPGSAGNGRLVLERSLRVGVVDPSRSYRAILLAVVDEQGWIGEAFEGCAALAAAAATRGFDVVVVDVAELARAGTALGGLLDAPEATLVALADTGEGLKLGLRLGATIAVRKPFDPELLALSIRAQVRGTAGSWRRRAPAPTG